jgi:hypothetical protein
MIERILSALNSIPADKVMHFASGTVLFALALPFMGARPALALVILAGVAKEIYDYTRKENHTPDVFDALATSFGGVVAFTCTMG